MSLVDDLMPGDVLLYRSSGIVGWWIRWKTWSDVNHCELYLGLGATATNDGPYQGPISAAARGPQDGKGGVQTYPFRAEGLVYVLRPNVNFDLDRMEAFHATCVGQKYDTLGVARVFYAGGNGDADKAFCSEHVARVCRTDHGGPGLFAPTWDCDKTDPGMLLCSPHCDRYVVQDGRLVKV